MEDLLAERGVVVGREPIRLWINPFGRHFANCVSRDWPTPYDKWPLLIRSTRRVELTRAGETFHDRAVRILSEIDLTAELTKAAGGSRVRQIKIGTVYPATIGMLPVFLGKIARKFPDVRIHIASGNTGDIIRGLETGQLNLGFIRPVESIGSLRMAFLFAMRGELKTSPRSYRCSTMSHRTGCFEAYVNAMADMFSLK